MNKILKNLFIINIVLFGMFFIGVGSADADSECIRCIYSYKEDVVNISETDATTSVAKHAKAQVVVQKKDDGKDASFSIKGICINNANNASAFTEALVGKCNFSNIDELNDSKTLKEHFYKNEKLSCPYMYIVSGGNSLTLHYIDKKPKDFTVDSKKTCDFNNNISAFTPDEKDPLTDGIPDTSSTGDTDYDHEAAKKIINWGKAAKDDKYLGEYSSGCDIIGDDVLVFLNNLFLIIQVIGIILLVFLSSVEFIKVITGSEDEGLSKALKNTLRRVIIVIILLILPLLITWILEIVNDNNYLTDENGKVVIGDDGNPLCRDGYSSGSGGGSGFSDDGGYDSPNVDSATSLKYAKVDRISSQKWRGKSIKPTVTVRLSGKKLVLNRDYTVTYKNNNKPGRATITIKGKGKYTGTKKVSFKIEGSDSTMSGADSIVKNQKGLPTGSKYYPLNGKKNGKKLQFLEFDGKYLTKTEFNELAQFIGDSVNNAGDDWGMRVAVAGWALTYGLAEKGVKLHYLSYGKWHLEDNKIINHQWGKYTTAAERARACKYGKINVSNSGDCYKEGKTYKGLDCDGFVSWAQRVGCGKAVLSWYGAKTKTTSDFSKAKPGDSVRCSGHELLFLKHSGNGTFIVAEASSASSAGVVFTKTSKEGLSKRFSGCVIEQLTQSYKKNCKKRKWSDVHK